jgi:hypothetical protein
MFQSSIKKLPVRLRAGILWWLRCSPPDLLFENTADVREDGENPSLPRNCKRSAVRLVFKQLVQETSESLEGER